MINSTRGLYCALEATRLHEWESAPNSGDFRFAWFLGFIPKDIGSWKVSAIMPMVPWTRAEAWECRRGAVAEVHEIYFC